MTAHDHLEWFLRSVFVLSMVLALIFLGFMVVFLYKLAVLLWPRWQTPSYASSCFEALYALLLSVKPFCGAHYSDGGCRYEKVSKHSNRQTSLDRGRRLYATIWLFCLGEERAKGLSVLRSYWWSTKEKERETMSTRKTQWITWANLMTYLYPITKKRARYLCDTRKVRTKPTEWNATHRLYYLPDVAKIKAFLDTERTNSTAWQWGQWSLYCL